MPSTPSARPDQRPVTPPPPALRPSSLLPLLRCAHCRLLLEAPTTLNCGHTVCSKHVSELPTRDPQPGPSLSPGTPAPPHTRLLACPVDSCRPRQPARVQFLGRTALNPRAGVAFSPAADPGIESTAANPHAPLRGRVVKLDVTISKLLQLITTATRTQASPVVSGRTRGDELGASESDTGDESDNEQQQSGSIGRAQLRSSPRDRVSQQNDEPSPSSSGRASSQSPPRPRKRPRTHIPVQTPTGLPDPPSSSTFEKELLNELTCEICFMLLCKPITTPCQHTFCSMCLERSLDHSTKCPLCRLDLPPNAYFYQHAQNEVIYQIILKAFPQQLEERVSIADSDGRDSRLDTPIFVCQLSYPGMPTLLHFFEPRYRLMLRRCLASPTPCFGMVMPRQNANNTDGNDYGTMLEIRNVQMLSDGRSMVETFGTFRFRILERGTLDGYLVSRVERIDDYPPEVEAEIERIALMRSAEDDIAMRVIERTNQELVDICRRFLDQLRNGTAPWVVQRLNNTYGPMPTDIASFSFWIALVLPIDEQEKAKLLPIRSARMRLRLVVHWIEQLNNNWWFSSGCVVG